MAKFQKKQAYARKQLERVIDLNNQSNPVLNDLISFWNNAGYSVSGNKLQKGLPNQLLATADLPVNKGGGGKRRRIALLKKFGRNILNQTEFIRLENDDNRILKYTRMAKIRRKDFQIQIPPAWGYNPRQVVTVELFGTITDIIPIVEIDYGTFVKGKYKSRGKTEREIRIEGVKRVRMGASAPVDIRGTINESTFWADVYSKLKNNLIDEFFKEGFAKDNWSPTPTFEAELKSDVTTGGKTIGNLPLFPNKSIEMRQK